MTEREIMRFKTTPDEIAEMMIHLGRQIYGARKQTHSFARSLLVWICVGFVATLVIAVFKRQLSPDLAEWVPGFLMFALGALCAFFGTLMWLSHFQRNRLLNHLRHSKASMEIAILQQDGGLVVAFGRSDSFCALGLV